MPSDTPAPAPAIASLADLGWRAHFLQQLDADELAGSVIVRVMSVHRSVLNVAAPGLEAMVAHFQDEGGGLADFATVGDWLLLEPATLRPKRLLDRFSLIKRVAPGKGRGLQLIAANLDTLFVVTSCNEDFNAGRLERYLTLAREAECPVVIVVTKADQATDAQAYLAAAHKVMAGLTVLAMDARDPSQVAQLLPWCGRGQTVGFVGSSGVGKSTLINTLTGEDEIATAAIREDDAKGRHTTSARSLHRLPSGGWLMDTPGMRELALSDIQHGLEEVFEDIAALARTCRFADCRHDQEPGCAVQAAIAEGRLDPARVARWQKLVEEDAFNSLTLHQRREKSRAFGRMVKSVTKARNKRR